MKAKEREKGEEKEKEDEEDKTKNLDAVIPERCPVCNTKKKNIPDTAQGHNSSICIYNNDHQ